MTRLRTASLAVVTAFAVSLGAAGTASAQDAPAAVPMTKTIAVSGSNKGKDFKGTYAIQRFEAAGGKLYAVGTLKGTLKNRKVTRKNVRMPASVAGGGPSSGATASQLPNIPGACQILNLQIGAIDLNLLGLRVRTNAINVRIDAQPGPGNLLGNLLCAITNLLNPGGGLGPLTGALNDLVAALNAILALLPTNASTAAAGR